IRRLDPEVAASTIGSGKELLSGPKFILGIISRLAAALGIISMVLAMAGLYAVLSHVMHRRSREIAVRVALGADRARIIRLVLTDGLWPPLKGITLGLIIGVGARLVLRSWVVTDISAFEPVVFALVPLPFVASALVACYLPAIRASRLDPNVALR